jgi:hypothetical protein
MIELLSDVLPWFLGFYLVEGFMSIGDGQLVLARGVSGWRMLRGGLHFSALWPSSLTFCGADLPFACGVEALYVCDRSGEAVLQPEDFVRREWPAPDAISVQRRQLHIGGRMLCKTQSESVAQALAALLRRVAAAPTKDRAKEIRAAFAERYALEPLAEQVAALAPWLRLLRLVGWLSFLGWFAALPWAAFSRSGRLPLLLVELAFIHLAILLTASWILVRAGSKERIAGVVATALFLPPMGARLVQAVARHLFVRSDLHAVAQVWLPTADAAPLVRRRARRAEIERERFAGHDAAVQFEAMAAGLAALPLASSEPRAAVDGAICPCCELEYRAGFGRCTDCDVGLI